VVGDEYAVDFKAVFDQQDDEDNSGVDREHLDNSEPLLDQAIVHMKPIIRRLDVASLTSALYI